MRLRKLDLTRYGKFSDHTLDFGASAQGRADFHIVYGPNEAGKSTTLAAYMDLLFGIGAQSAFGFLHDYKSMLIGATIEANGEALSLTRTKGNKDTLRDETGNVVDPARLSAILHGLDRDTYGTMFSLDGARLESGGEDILASKGELGRLLFSAASGMADIGGTLETLRGDAAKFFAAGKRKHELGDLKDELKALDDERKALDTHAADFERLRETLAAAKTRREEVQAERNRIARDKENLENLKGAFPLAQELTELNTAEAALADYPPLDDPALLDEVAKLREARTEARTIEQAATDEITRIDAALADQKPDAAALALADRLAQMQGLQRRYHTGRDDLEKRTLERDKANAAVTAALAALGAPAGTAAETLLQPVDALARLDALLGEHTLLTAALDTAIAEKSDADETLKSLQGSTATDAAPVDTAPLAPLLARIRADDPTGKVQRAQEALDRAVAEAERLLPALAPWTGTPDALLGSTAPAPDQAAAWRDRARKIADDMIALENRRAKDSEDLARNAAAISSMTGAQGVVSDTQAADARASRDTAWRTHRTVMDDQTADAFERALDADDRAQADRLAQSDRLATLRELEQTRGSLQAGLTAIGAEQTRLAALQNALSAELSAPLNRAGLPADYDPLGLPAWLTQRSAAAAAATRAQSARDDYDDAVKRAATHKNTLGAALSQAGIAAQAGLSLDRLLDAADALIEREKTAALNRATVEKTRADAARNADKRSEKSAEAKNALDDWQARWTDALGGTWLQNRTPAEVSALLPTLRRLSDQIETQADKIRRVASLERDIAAFEAALDALNADAPEDRAEDAGARFAKLSERVSSAKLAEAQNDTRTTAREGHVQKRTNAAAKRTAITERVTEIAARYPATLEITDVDALARALNQSATRAELQKKIASQQSALTGLLGAESLAGATALLSGTTLRDVTAALGGIDGDYQQAEAERDEAIGAHRDAENAIQAVGGDAAVARLEEQRATLLLDIAEKASACLRLTLGVMAAERALHLYRDRHRSAMMSRTADAFRTITGGAFDKLETQPAGKAERLIAIRKNGGASVGVDGMSTATRHQLYFALRLAGYEDFCQKSGPLPLIADDILESFDEDRAAEAFTQLRTLAHKGQAIYLTHHRHLCTIAKDLCGDDVTIHDL